MHGRDHVKVGKEMTYSKQGLDLCKVKVLEVPEPNTPPVVKFEVTEVLSAGKKTRYKVGQEGTCWTADLS